ncbi:hypothetical protein EYF80_018539 [Liparis tanakae]|uniref:Uncharacterized protein n=1 Tax=Liparis tanakae TaxID=230148 RepID=A0A4Z2I052_9TELE|nr:hypothetical protein EYF80_018539 [Liparis tanakae]
MDPGLQQQTVLLQLGVQLVPVGASCAGVYEQLGVLGMVQTEAWEVTASRRQKELQSIIPSTNLLLDPLKLRLHALQLVSAVQHLLTLLLSGGQMGSAEKSSEQRKAELELYLITPTQTANPRANISGVCQGVS